MMMSVLIDIAATSSPESSKTQPSNFRTARGKNV